ncbi:MAG: hypothetical protein AUJ37_01135 [Candidatus Magasanikbacteria bacterium CG1_02_41_34]|nr:MAG: hypothetical protein AUJ37_01135 [Candidatus Magasanikbacteria bacterium CG1_02_41_34]
MFFFYKDIEIPGALQRGRATCSWPSWPKVWSPVQRAPSTSREKKTKGALAEKQHFSVVVGIQLFVNWYRYPG